MAKITLYQKAAANYHLTSDAAVKHWLANVQTYSDKERCVMSVCLSVCVCLSACSVCMCACLCLCVSVFVLSVFVGVSPSFSHHDNVIVTIVTNYQRY